MFKDKVRLKFRSGKGGNGYISFNRARKPSGGDGGRGGDIILVGSIHVRDLSAFHPNEWYKAQPGVDGGKERLTGRNGENLIVKVPLVTNVYDLEGNLIMTLDKDGEEKILITAGFGGYGNYYFKGKGPLFREKSTPGKPGKEIEVKLEVELESDVIFIGLPNAGKSSILREMTNANAKVAAYAFTTLEPQLGICDDIILMDLPGLIEDTSEGKGLGINFVKHTKRTKLIGHFLSLESDDILRDYKVIRKEIDIISEHFKNLPEIIVLTKSDLVDEKVIKDSIKKLKKVNKNIQITSAYDLESMGVLKNEFRKVLGKI